MKPTRTSPTWVPCWMIFGNLLERLTSICFWDTDMSLFFLGTQVLILVIDLLTCGAATSLLPCRAAVASMRAGATRSGFCDLQCQASCKYFWVHAVRSVWT
eukprot:SM001325S26679  [mRNA]  locus=s1325:1358:1660:- [translate_table: standard]